MATTMKYAIEFVCPLCKKSTVTDWWDYREYDPEKHYMVCDECGCKMHAWGVDLDYTIMSNRSMKYTDKLREKLLPLLKKFRNMIYISLEDIHK